MYVFDESVTWTWDDAKDDENVRKHDVDFEMATRVFRDQMSFMYEDPFRGERRWRTIGMVDGLVLIVVHTLPDEYEEPRHRIGRIISARKAERYERRAYEEGRVRTHG